MCALIVRQVALAGQRHLREKIVQARDTRIEPGFPKHARVKRVARQRGDQCLELRELAHCASNSFGAASILSAISEGIGTLFIAPPGLSRVTQATVNTPRATSRTGSPFNLRKMTV